MQKTKKSSKKGVLEKYLFRHSSWESSFAGFYSFLQKPEMVCCIFEKEHQSIKLLRVDRKGHLSSNALDKKLSASDKKFLMEKSEQLLDRFENQKKTVKFVKTPKKRPMVAFPLRYLGSAKAVLYLTGYKMDYEALRPKIRPYLQIFQSFLDAQIELAYKYFELDNFFETVHPRALALSTMHSVHRVISSSLRLNELLPRIGRLSAQILKAQGCSIMLVDKDEEHLIPSFSFGQHSRFIHRHRLKIGRGIEGRIAGTGEFCLTKNYIGVPFIDENIVGLIILWDKVNDQCFTSIDLEILKSLSEQAVIAIKNANLYEETERLTIGSIKTINELLEKHFGHERSHLAVVGEIVLEVGKELRLRGHELVTMERAILLLDTGQLAFPELTWTKKGKLTKKEFSNVKSVPKKGAKILKSITSLKPVIPIILHRHERYDGEGYPNGLAGENIPIGARVVSVVDSFIAMISTRSYRKQKTIEEAIDEIELHRGTQFDPTVVDAFLKVMSNHDMVAKVKKIAKKL